ncbi:hypothetical protein Zm00014a_030776 [Zea mays]|jgi:hypothetical protein|uniref:Uncharacterized protein n=1 Tax=Zea mays TaxID=4577 RepID=A0A317Y7V4_MAIZE|nr:hypothetical protein Zm00014a_030776 [Zea mays]
MTNDGTQSARGGRRCCCGTLTRADLLVFLLAAALCSASYCLGVWHNSRGAADSRVLAPSAGVTYCGNDAGEPLDFETRHAAEDAGLSAPTTAAAAAGTTSTRRALRGAADGGIGMAWAEAGGVRVRLTGAVAVQA